ncbi:hypothetical protein CS022_01715 [Veronia nyctiphanis]|uniref:Uncharacterized protein n=1 Tax=Veronia nyctiphanis TaxID=1278244 RepID=A0A4Q0YUG5_9GAMM|nr:hypothetical protein [Veronia nyctiphanis]RXJ74927.1 hypothetical protein CS022_01715 [Veronia nyctiphanis]
MKTIKLPIFLAFFSFSLSAYEINSTGDTALSPSKFVSDNGSPEVIFEHANAECLSNCRKSLTIGNHKYTYSTDSSLVSQSRYRRDSWALVQESYQGADNHVVNFWMVNAVSQSRWASIGECASAKTIAIDKSGRLICVDGSKLHIVSKDDAEEIELPVEPIIASLNNNLDGELAIALIDKQTMELQVSTLSRLVRDPDTAWQSVQTKLHLRSDFDDTLVVFPENDETIAVASYEYVNVFNKGLATYLFTYGKAPTRRVVANSFKRNYGFNPDLYLEDGDLIVSAFDSTQGERYGYQIAVDELYEPEPFQSFFSSPARVDLLAGYGVMSANWLVNQEVDISME